MADGSKFDAPIKKFYALAKETVWIWKLFAVTCPMLGFLGFFLHGWEPEKIALYMFLPIGTLVIFWVMLFVVVIIPFCIFILITELLNGD